jgi:hypothetical protein
MIADDSGKKHRNRKRPPGSLRQRLLALARIARRRAEELPPGALREKLLKKAELSERSAAIESWLSSPGAELPD